MGKPLQGDMNLFLSTFCIPVDWADNHLMYSLSSVAMEKYPGLMPMLCVAEEMIIMLVYVQGFTDQGPQRRSVDKDISYAEFAPILRECLDEAYKHKESLIGGA